MRFARTVVRGLLWGVLIGAIAASIYGVVFVAVSGPGGRWSLIGGLGFIYGAPAGAVFGLTFGYVAAVAVRDETFGAGTVEEMTRLLTLFCAIPGIAGIAVALLMVGSDSRNAFEWLGVLTVPAVIACLVGRRAIPRFSERYLAAGF